MFLELVCLLFLCGGVIGVAADCLDAFLDKPTNFLSPFPLLLLFPPYLLQNSPYKDLYNRPNLFPA